MNTDIRALKVGQVLSDYRIESILGQGAFGITYLVIDTMLNRKFAIKEYYPREFAHRDSTLTVHAAGNKDDQDTFTWGLTRFLDEARLLARFDHPNIIAVRRFFEANGTAYLVMDYCEGIPLDELIKNNGPLSESEIDKIIGPLLAGLKQVHASNFLHRDIKPANIFIRSDGSPVLLDFGAARQELVNHSKSITSLATPGYAAFEQYSTQGKQGPWTDIYGLAATLYRAVTGEKPQDAPDRILEDTLVPAAVRVKGKYSERLLKAIDKGMSVRPNDRPQSIFEWESELVGTREADPDANKLSVQKASPPSISGSMIKEVGRVDASSQAAKVTLNNQKTSLYLLGGGGLLVATLTVMGAIYFSGGKSGPEKQPPKPIQEPTLQNQVSQLKTGADQDKKLTPAPAASEQAQLPKCKEPYSATAWTNCIGKATYPNGDFYSGEYKNGKYDGHGKYVYANGDFYEGDYKNGIIEGQGIYTFANGEKYTGQWRNGKNNGRGTYKQANGGVYIGEFKDNLRDGNGSFTLPSGFKFVGRYGAGKMIDGTLTYPDGSKYKGSFDADGKYNGEGVTYSPTGVITGAGSWVHGEMIGNKNDPDAIYAKCTAKSNEANRDLPKQVDNITSMTKTFCMKNGNIVSYVVNLQLTSDDKFTNDQLNTAAYSKVKNKMCADPSLKEYTKFVDFDYRYTARDGSFIGSLRYPKNVCQ
jgi:serine/threonine protein kinase